MFASCKYKENSWLNNYKEIKCKYAKIKELRSTDSLNKITISNVNMICDVPSKAIFDNLYNNIKNPDYSGFYFYNSLKIVCIKRFLSLILSSNEIIVSVL